MRALAGGVHLCGTFPLYQLRSRQISHVPSCQQWITGEILSSCVVWMAVYWGTICTYASLLLLDRALAHVDGEVDFGKDGWKRGCRKRKED